MWTGQELTQIEAGMIRDRLIESLKPAGDKGAAVVLDRCLKHLGIPDNWEETAEDFVDELSALPADVLERIGREARRTFKYFPKICDFLELIPSDYYSRQRELMKINLYIKMQGPR